MERKKPVTNGLQYQGCAWLHRNQHCVWVRRRMGLRQTSYRSTARLHQLPRAGGQPAQPYSPLKRPSLLLPLRLCPFSLSSSPPPSSHTLLPQRNLVTNLKKPRDCPLPSSRSPLLGNLAASRGSPRASPTHHVHARPVMLSSRALCSDGLRMPFPCSGCMPWSSAVC